MFVFLLILSMVLPTRRRTVRRPRRTNFVTKASFRLQLLGSKFQPVSNPRQIAPRPWKQQVLVFQGTGNSTFTDAALIAGVATQNHITVNTDWEITVRIIKASAWQEVPRVTSNNVPDPLNAPFTVTFLGVYSEGDITVLSDYAAPTQFARVGYRWPKDHQTIVLAASPATTLIKMLPTDTDQSWVLHVELLWTTQPSADRQSRIVGSEVNIGTYENLRMQSSTTSVSSSFAALALDETTL